jgi:hypothetical protein
VYCFYRQKKVKGRHVVSSDTRHVNRARRDNSGNAVHGQNETYLGRVPELVRRRTVALVAAGGGQTTAVAVFLVVMGAPGGGGGEGRLDEVLEDGHEEEQGHEDGRRRKAE